MPKSQYQCSVDGCREKYIMTHRFPNPRLHKDRLLEWIRLVGLTNMNPETVYNKKRICHRHFSDDCFSVGTKRLNCNAYPTLFMPVSSEVTFIHNVPLQLHSTSINQHFILETPCNAIDNVSSIEVDVPQPHCSSDNLDVSGIGTLNLEDTETLEDTGITINDVMRLLKKIGFSRCNQLTPHCRKFYGIINKLIKQLKKQGAKKKLFKQQLKAAESMSEKYLNNKFSEKMTVVASLFTKLQLRETKKKNKGRRFSLDEKIMSLSLYKRSPKCYRLLSIMFTLPSPKTLQNVLSSVSITTGVSPIVMKVLKEKSEKLKPLERYCTLMFGEVCLSSGLHYNKTTDQIDGFVDSASNRNQEYADHALVFMVRGIKKKFKQPVAYTFCQGATKHEQLAVLLKEVVREVQKTGLQIVATISDQGRSNDSAIKLLMNETKEFFIKRNEKYTDDIYEIQVDDQKIIQIVHIFDVPHLIKCIRNHLLTKDLVFSINREKGCAKWSHIQNLYSIDSAIPDCKMLPRISDQHVVPEKILKMKVKCATQIFSQCVSSTMMFLSSKNLIDPTAKDTARICLFFDKLFDSLNGSFDGIVDGKIYRTSIKKESPHHALWTESLQVLSTMKFINKNGKTCAVPTLNNWMKTIRGFQRLFKTLSSNGIRSLLPRHINQDPLECFFGAARSVSSSNPSCHAFASAYKTLLLNNLMSSNSPGSNCEDIVEASLTSYRNLILKDPNVTNEVQNNCNITVDLPITIYNVPVGINDIREHVHTYIAGYILKKLNKNLFKNCSICLKNLCANNVTSTHDLVTARDYTINRQSLKYPSQLFASLVQQIIVYVSSQMSKICHHKNICMTLSLNIKSNFNFKDLPLCPNHNGENFEKKIINNIVNVMLNHWSTEINRILIGKKKIHRLECDPMKLKANVWHVKHFKKPKKHIRKI